MDVNRIVGVALAAAWCGAAACGGGPTGPPPTAVLQIGSTPATIVSAVCPPSHCGPLTGQLEVLATLTIRETAGVAGVVNRVTFVVRRQSDNASVAQSDAAPAARFTARGSVTLPLALHFEAAASESNMKVVVTVEAGDDNGHTISTSTEVLVLPGA